MSENKRLSKSAESLKSLTMRYFSQAHKEARAGKPVAWIAIIVPIEILKGFDLVVGVPENHAAACAARGVGAAQAEKAEQQGYSVDLCSYARIDLGTWISGGEGSPTMGLPKPDLVISNNNNCSLLVKWFDVYRRELGIPHFTLDVPFCYAPQTERDTDYILGQFKELIQLIEKQTGQKFNEEKVREAVRLTNEANRHWKRFLGLAAHRPSGITAFDSFVHMAPYITSFRGTQDLVNHMKLLADEAEEDMQQNAFPVPTERYRLLWDNIAPWHQLRKMSGRLAELNANVICATYTSCMGTIEGSVEHYEYDGGDPIAYLARIQNFSVCPYGLQLRYKAMGALIEKFGINGVIFASNRSCKVYSVMQMDLKKMIERDYGIPAVMIDVDHADSRKYSEESAFTRIEALLETIPV